MKDNYPTYEQHFEVVLMRKGVSEDAATPEDFKRVAIVAKDQMAAMIHDDVTLACGEDFHRVQVTLPNNPTGPEMMARRRAIDPDGSKRTTNW